MLGYVFSVFALSKGDGDAGVSARVHNTQCRYVKALAFCMAMSHMPVTAVGIAFRSAADIYLVQYHSPMVGTASPSSLAQ